MNHIEDALKAIFSSHHPALLVLFGSFARGDNHFNSDVDVAVKMPVPLSLQTKMEFIEQLASATGRSIDLIDLHTAGEPLLGQILAEGQRIIEQPGEWGSLVFKHLMNQADFVPLQQYILTQRREQWLKQS